MKLRDNGKAPVEDIAAWRRLLVESYARKYKRDDAACEVRFNIKSNVLFTNGQPDFGDYIHHEIEIPYRWKDDGEPQTAAFLQSEVEAQLSIRVLVVNGLLMLQVGRFDKTYSPRIIRGGSLAVYETFATVTTFPLMYFHLDHGLPTKYLNLLAKATPSYREGLGNGRSKKQYADWDALQRDVAAYRMLCDGGNRDYSYKTMDRLFQSFKTKRDEILAGEGYETHERSEDDWRYPDTGHSYWNKYSTVFFRNMNANRDGLTDARWFADYYEEQP